MIRSGDRDAIIAHLVLLDRSPTKATDFARAEEGTTPMRWFWQQRLTASYDALTGGRMHRVTDVALNFGFTDVSHFNRSFKKRFGCPPHTLLRR